MDTNAFYSPEGVSVVWGSIDGVLVLHVQSVNQDKTIHFTLDAEQLVPMLSAAMWSDTTCAHDEAWGVLFAALERYLLTQARAEIQP